MRDLLWLIPVVLYLLVTVYVTEWRTLTVLEQRLLTPMYYLTHPRVYHLVEVVLLGLAFGSASLFAARRWFEVAGALAALSICLRWLGRLNAFATIRKSCLESMREEQEVSHRNPAAFAEIVNDPGYAESCAIRERLARKSNAEFMKMLKVMRM